MPEIDKKWVAEQLQAAKVKVGSGKAIMKLLDTWSELPDLSEPMIKEILTVFPKLAVGHAIKEEESEDDYIWIPVQPGQISVGEVIRIKADAYSGEQGTKFNNRRGKVVGIRYGEVYFKSTDEKLPLIDGIPHSPYKLEKQVRKA